MVFLQCNKSQGKEKKSRALLPRKGIGPWLETALHYQRISPGPITAVKAFPNHVQLTKLALISTNPFLGNETERFVLILFWL
jgi:hypothetical protein